jgi:hypothetical protein
VLHWEYHWAGLASNSDGFILEESNSSSSSGFSVLASTVNQNDHRAAVDYQVAKTVNGTYWYRVRAKTAKGYSPDSNIAEVLVDTGNQTPMPTTLRIHNDLYGAGDWDMWNGLIRVRIATTCEAAMAGAGERLFPYESTTDVANLERIAPNETRDYDVSTVQLASGNTYCLFIQAGWWDYFCFGSCAWTKHDTEVIGCHGQVDTKSAPVRIERPFRDPEYIRVSDFLPNLSSWEGHPGCAYRP